MTDLDLDRYLYRHIPSGEVYAVEQEPMGGRWVGIAGPLSHRDYASPSYDPLTINYEDEDLEWALDQWWAPLTEGPPNKSKGG